MMVYPCHVSGYRTKIYLQYNTKEDVYLLTVLYFYLKYGIFMHFKCFLTNKHIWNTLMSQKYIMFLQYFDFCHTK